MFRVFPELVRIFKNTSSKTVLQGIERYPTPDKLKELSLDELKTDTLERKAGVDLAKIVLKDFLMLPITLFRTREGLSGLLMKIDYLLSQILQNRFL